MKAAEHIPNKSDATIKSSLLSERFSRLVIPWRWIALYASLSLGFFLLGFVPMWFKASSAIEQRDASQREVRLSQLQNTLGAAMVDVQRGEYEPARQLTSDFYTNLRSQIDAANASVFTPAQRETLRPLLTERDEVITLLARSDPAAVDRLFAIYSSYNKITTIAGLAQKVEIPPTAETVSEIIFSESRSVYSLENGYRIARIKVPN